MKNENDVKILQRIIREQNALGASLPEELNDWWGYYEWDGSGRLVGLHLVDCKLSGTLDLSGLDALTKADLRFNQLARLVLGNNSRLMDMDCHENQIHELDISGARALKKINCACNPLGSLDQAGNPLGCLDISGCPVLKKLDATSCCLASIHIGANSALEVLYVGRNGLTCLDVAGNPALRRLNCRYNPLEELDISKNFMLEELECHGCRLTGLDAGGNPVLKRISAYSCQMTFLKTGPALEYLDCQSNWLTSLDVTGSPAIEYLNCLQNQIAELDITCCRRLMQLRCDDIPVCRQKEKDVTRQGSVSGRAGCNHGRIEREEEER